jgi:HEAT repeat protein
VGQLEATPIDYKAFTFAEGPSVDPAERDAQELWESLGNMLTDAGETTPEAGPEQLAGEISQEIERHEGTGLGMLRKSVQDASSQIESARPDWRALARERFGQFVAALNPRLRYDLLRVDPRAPGASMELLEQLADVVPDADLIEVLQKIDRSGARVPSQLMTLMNKMVRISRTRPTLASGLQSTLAKWGISEAAFSVPSSSIGVALEEVFQRRDRLECNPEPYQDLLDDLSRNQLRVEDLSYEKRYRDPRDAEDVRVHAAEVATRVLNFPGGQQYRPALFGYVGAETDALIERGKFGVLQDAAVAATTYSQLDSESNDTYRAARGFLHELQNPECIASLLAQVRDRGELTDAATSLIRLGGGVALGGVLDSACEELNPELTESLLRLAASFTPEELRQALVQRTERPWTSLRHLFPTIRELPDAMALQVLEKLLVHEEERVRLEALLAVCDLERRHGAAERHLRRALEDPSLQVVAAAIQRLGERETEGASEILAGYLMDTQGRRIEIAFTVARALEPHRDDPEVQRALRQWRLCPAGLLRGFVSSSKSRKRREERP